MLAAGRGMRMGGPKALMVCDGTPWWRIQRARIALWGAREIWVVNDAVAEAMRTDPDQPPMVMGDASAPMFDSIALGMAHFRDDPPIAVSVLPVDVPACSGEAFRALCAATDRPTAPTHDGRRGHPIRLPWAFIASTILPRIDDHAWVATARLDVVVRDAVAEVPVDDSSVVVNLNTPEDLARWGGGAPPMTAE